MTDTVDKLQRKIRGNVNDTAVSLTRVMVRINGVLHPIRDLNTETDADGVNETLFIEADPAATGSVEVWFEVEASRAGENDFYTTGGTFDSLAGAKDVLEQERARVDGFDWRVVEKTVATRVIL